MARGRARVPFAVTPRSDPDGGRIGLDHCAEKRVEPPDPVQVGLRELAAREFTGGHERA